jgi:hypothetical protein
MSLQIVDLDAWEKNDGVDTGDIRNTATDGP